MSEGIKEGLLTKNDEEFSIVADKPLEGNSLLL